MAKEKKSSTRVQGKQKDPWCVTAEITQNTLFMMSLALPFMIQKWSRLGLGDKVKEHFTYFKGDFCQMWYKRREFDAEADFLASKMIKNPAWALAEISKVEKWSKKLMKEAKKFREMNFTKMEAKEMVKSFYKVTKWHELAHGVGASVSWHADADRERITQAISNVIKEQIEKRNLNLEPTRVFSLLSTPSEESWALMEEKEFLKIAQKISARKKIKEIFKNTRLEFLENRIKKADPQVFKLIYSHFQKWNWLPYGYRGPAYDFGYFLGRWQALFKAKNEPAKLLKELTNKNREIRLQHGKLLKKLKFNSHQLKLVKLAQGMVFIKEFRKGAIYYAMYCYEPFFRKVARRLNLTLEHVWVMNFWEIGMFLRKGKAPKKELTARTKEAVAYATPKKYSIWTGKKARNFFKKIPKEKVIPKGKIWRLTGTCASLGKARGAVKIVDVPQDMAKMRPGDILVSETTYPSLVPAMKKAAAIVTNAGGLTCHAAIVSRELGIPCVVGTKIANKVLKDGNVVEVEADKGIVKILK